VAVAYIKAVILVYDAVTGRNMKSFSQDNQNVIIGLLEKQTRFLSTNGRCTSD
jgi:hypothetical protein